MRERYHDGEGDTAAIETVQDVEPILDRNKAFATEDQNDWWRLAASIPDVVTLQWMRDDGIFWPKLPKREKTAYLRRKLNDSDWRHLKTIPGNY